MWGLVVIVKQMTSAVSSALLLLAIPVASSVQPAAAQPAASHSAGPQAAGTQAVGRSLLASSPQETSSAGQGAISGAPLSAWTAGGLIEPSGRSQFAASSESGFGQVGGCVFYASSSSAGGYCATGGGITGPAQSLAAWLHGQEFYRCRFMPVPDGMYINAPDRPGGRWMLKACFQNYELSEPWGGRDTTVEIFIQFVKNDEDLSRPPYTLPGYMEQFWDYQANRNYYPIPRISVGPKSYALVNTYTFFWTSWVDAIDSSKQVDPDYKIPYQTLTLGEVYLHAAIGKVTIHPGLQEMEKIECGKADVPFDPEASDYIPDSEGGDQPSECFTVYEHSTASRDEDTLQIRATAYWRVTVEDANGEILADLGLHHYEADQRMAVAEVQTLTGYDSDD